MALRASLALSPSGGARLDLSLLAALKLYGTWVLPASTSVLVTHLGAVVTLGLLLHLLSRCAAGGAAAADLHQSGCDRRDSDSRQFSRNLRAL